ncbi:Cytochrome P450 [Canna indica]|uniref:Cytochrome P450 n=1 Tax=Canna indica TaxID=4628 RepID=A0AAQ3Q117_9LILI|nr:Cytochrome P450 [Canna indica]
METFFTSSLLIFTLLFMLLLASIKKISKKKPLLPPSPPGLPLIGNLLQLGSLPHRSLHSLSNKYGPLMLLHLGQIPTLVISSPETAKEILKTHDRIFASRPPSNAINLIHGTVDLAFAPYSEYWRQLRKLTTVNLLCAKKVQSYRVLWEEEVAVMVERIRRASSSGPVNISKALNTFAADMITRVVSGRNFRESGRDELFCKLVEENNAALGMFYFEDFFPTLGWMDELLGISTKARRNGEGWAAALEEVIEDHDAMLEDGDDEEEEKDFVDALLSLLKKPDRMDIVMSRKETKALMLDMFAAGTGTMYTTLLWAMAELARNPEAMKKLQDEVRRSTKEDKKEILIIKDEDLKRMVYLKAVLKEVLRLHPATPLLVPRISMEDCEIRGFHIPKQTRVLINAWAIGRHPGHWDEAEEFRPERFLNNAVDFKGNDMELIPFGAGRRICPGLHFAVTIVELALANLVHGFDWELPHGLTTAEMDMTEAPGLSVGKKIPLYLVAKPWVCL